MTVTMKTRSKTSRDATEDDRSSLCSEDLDSTLTDDNDDESTDEECFECGQPFPFETLFDHKGASWCAGCINIDKNKKIDKNEKIDNIKQDSPKPQYIPESARPTPEQRTRTWPLLWIGLGLLIPVILAVISGYSAADLKMLYSSSAAGGSKKLKMCSDLKAEMKQLKSDFGTQESDTWLNFYSGISNVLPGPNPVGSTTFLLLHEAKARQTADRIARQVGRLAAACLGGNLLHLDGASMADRAKHKLFLQTYQKKVEESRVLYVSEFGRLPSAVAKEFHFFCDSYTPLVPQAVFLLLLQVDRLPAGEDLTAAAEVELKRIWARELQSNIIQPLITRITANVVRIYE